MLIVVMLSSLIAACTKQAAPPPYTINMREISKDNYQIVLEGEKDINQQQLRGFMQAKADELCNNAFVLRQNKEESLLARGETAINPHAKYDRYGLTVEIECVTEGWVSAEDEKAMMKAFAAMQPSAGKKIAAAKTPVKNITKNERKKAH